MLHGESLYVGYRLPEPDAALEVWKLGMDLPDGEVATWEAVAVGAVAGSDSTSVPCGVVLCVDPAGGLERPGLLTLDQLGRPQHMLPLGSED